MLADSLSSLQEQLLRSNLGRPLISVDSEWFETIHGTAVTVNGLLASEVPASTEPSNGDQVRGAEDDAAVEAEDSRSFAAVRAHLDRLAVGQLGPPCTAIFAHVNRAVQGGGASGGGGEFMGPMCCPLTKTRIPRLVAEDYLVTEKSDGIRTVMSTHYVRSYPTWIAESWVAAPSAGSRSKSFTFTLYDGATLEKARASLLLANAAESEALQLGGGLGQRRLIPLSKEETQQYFAHTHGTYHQHRATDEECFRLELDNNSAATAEESVPSLFVRRTTSRGRYFSYLFDRSMGTPSLLLEEITFPNLLDVVLDGELLLPRQPPAGTSSKPPLLLYAAFDCFSFTLRPGQKIPACLQAEVCSYADVEEGSSSAVVQPREPESQMLTFSPMKDRYSLMGEVVVGPMEQYYHQFGLPFPQSMSVVRKRMFEKQELSDLVSMLRTTDDGKHIFGDLTYNDGLIFTPNNFPVTAGAAEAQLKWKWPDSLTVDWQLSPAPKQPGVYNALMFFRKKRLGDADSVGHAWYDRIPFDNPKQVVIPPGGFAIAECYWNPAAGRWSILRLREDKKEANSAVTVVSVLESVCEQLDLESLLRSFGHQQQAKTLLPKMLRPQPPQKIEPMQFILRCTREKDETTAMRLQWTVKLPSVKHPIVCNHCLVRTQCYGLGYACPTEDPDSNLESLLAIHLANDGGCYAWSDTTVEAQFDPEKGMWGIGSVGRNKAKARVSAVIKHLEHIAAVLNSDNPKIQQLEGSEITHNKGSAVASNAAMENGNEEGDGDSDDTQAQQDPVHTNKHYAKRTRELAHLADSERTELRRHNNWVKSVLIAETVATLLHCHNNPSTASAPLELEKLAVLDLCCGRGGDLHKWKKHPMRYLMMVDSCFDAMGVAAQRYSVARGLSTRITPDKAANAPGIPAYFHVVDCFSTALSSVIEAQKMFQPKIIGQGFDIVSCQFSMHYAFSSEDRVQKLLHNIATALRPGGLYIATTPDDRVLAELGDDFSNEAYSVSFLPDEEQSQYTSYGRAYRTSYDVGVDSEVEFLVDWAKFVELAKAHSLEVVATENFSEFRERAKSTLLGAEMYTAIMKNREEAHVMNYAATANENATGTLQIGSKRTTREEGGDGRGLLGGSDGIHSAETVSRDIPAVEPSSTLSMDELKAASFYRTLVLRKTSSP